MAESKRSRASIVGNKKSQREAWDATMREEVGVTSIPGQTPQKRHKTRALKERVASKKHNVHGGLGELEFKRLARLERLECTNAWDPLERSMDIAGDDDGGSSGDERVKRRRVDKRHLANRKQVFLADVLMQEGPASEFVRAQARKSTRPCPTRVCDVTGKAAKYRDPLTGLWVHDRRAIAVLKEHVPSWLKATAVSPYWDAVKSLQNESS